MSKFRKGVNCYIWCMSIRYYHWLCAPLLIYVRSTTKLSDSSSSSISSAAAAPYIAVQHFQFSIHVETAYVSFLSDEKVASRDVLSNFSRNSTALIPHYRPALYEDDVLI
jgi:hypothetical protein